MEYDLNKVEYMLQYYLKNKDRLDEYTRNYRHNHKDWVKKLNSSRIKFKNKRIKLKFNPRIGICSKCNKSIQKNEIKQTQIHHTEYDDINPLANTIELCVSCHRKEHT